MYYITLAAENGAEPHALSTEELQKQAYLKEIIPWEDRRTKKIVNTPKHCTDDVLHEIYATRPDIARYVKDDLHCYCMAKKKQEKVAIITDGGTGYLPLFLGYVKENLLNGCGVSGVFQSPSSEQIYNAAKEAETGAGVLSFYGNCTGDITNPDMTAEMLDMDDVRIASTVGANNVLSNEDAQMRRGVTRIFFMYEYAGTRVTRVGTLEEVLAVVKKAEKNTKAAGFALTPCVTPGTGHSNFTLAEGKMAFGMRIHGEPGVQNELVKTADELAEEPVGEILADVPLNSGERVCVLVDGLGATSQEELYILSGSMHRLLEGKGIRVYQTFVGKYVTSMKITEASVFIRHMTDQEMER